MEHLMDPVYLSLYHGIISMRTSLRGLDDLFLSRSLSVRELRPEGSVQTQSAFHNILLEHPRNYIEPNHTLTTSCEKDAYEKIA